MSGQAHNLQTRQYDHVEAQKAVREWNWGAFLLTWIWGLFHKNWFSLLALIPFLNILIMIYLGIRGNRIAWDSRVWKSIESFRLAQQRWAMGGVAFIIAVSLFWVAFNLRVSSDYKDHPLYLKTLEMAQTHDELVAYLGEPVHAGVLIIPDEELDLQENEKAFAYNLSGSRRSAKVFTRGKETEAGWQVNYLVAQLASKKQRINLLGDEG